MLGDDERALFMQANGLSYDVVSVEEKARLAEKLIGLAGVTKQTLDKASYYKVPFQQALSLLGSRSVYLEAGLVYVPLQRLVSILTARFRVLLSRALTEAASMLDIVGADQRIAPFLQNINKQFVGNDFSQLKSLAADKLVPERVDGAADAHMPLCMKTLHGALKREHKLKHWGRLQYGLFLKGAVSPSSPADKMNLHLELAQLHLSSGAGRLLLTSYVLCPRAWTWKARWRSSRRTSPS
jgi:DNA primase large subunit